MIKGKYFHKKKISQVAEGGTAIRLGFLLVLFFIFFGKIAAQDSLKTLLHVEQQNTYFNTDDLRNLYLINDKEEIVKYNSEGQETYRYSNTRLDRPTLIDATDPFNVLLFYPDYQTVVLLDRTMTETAILNLVDFGFFNVNSVAISGDNKIWLYDELSFRLKKVDRNGKIMQESDDLSLLLDSEINPNFIMEREQTVFVNAPDVGILVFDFFGQYIKTLDFKNLAEFQILKDLLLFKENGILQSFHMKTLLTSPVKLPRDFSKNSTIQLRQGRLYESSEKGITMYAF